jgi:hypothetical protein
MNSTGTTSRTTIIGVKITGTGVLKPPSGLGNARSVVNLSDSIGVVAVKYA